MTAGQTLFTGASRPGLYRLRAGVKDSSIEQSALAHGWRVAHVDGNAIRDKRSFIQTVGLALSFPAYSATNWDAFEESLRDLSWLPERGVVVLYTAAAGFPAADADAWATARAILADAAESSPARGKTLVILFRNAGRRLPGVAWL